MAKILLIEPNVAHAKLIRERLKAELDGVHIDDVPGLKAGLTLLSRDAYDCILTDSSTPEASGVKLIRQLKKSAGHASIIVVTGRLDEKQATEIIRSGASDYVFKSRNSLDTIPELVKRNLVKAQVKNPLLIPAHMLGKILDEIERNVSKDVRTKIRKIRKNTEKLLRRAPN
ncbi:MAG TPA: response regulator [bacterium]|nr:response regulator [bacterium]